MYNEETIVIGIEGAQIINSSKGESRLRKHLLAAQLSVLILRDVLGLSAFSYIVGSQFEVRDYVGKINAIISELAENNAVLQKAFSDLINQVYEELSSNTVDIWIKVDILSELYNIFSRQLQDIHEKPKWLLVRGPTQRDLIIECRKIAEQELGRRLEKLFSNESEQRAFCKDFVKWIRGVLKELHRKYKGKEVILILVTHDSILAEGLGNIINTWLIRTGLRNGFKVVELIYDACENTPSQLTQEIIYRSLTLVGGAERW